ncbi:hypothetical protein H712_02981 [Brucella ovis IntaBari-2009-88-4]|uniref:MarR family winged helix-turn-helix transcriptional regulator n=2 Tax=Brucella ovis TaxID=236 RepID=UPI0002D08DDD|nr:helix-turn-helix domain-containing protein [Brucella ovis]ENQ99405.1 hypothetical protein C010_03005 [Brucella ovis 80/125]ENR05687.1 hypothetical protein C961_02705 [Brucella ovis F8/05B]ENS92385.1 hypothetical protein B999_02972 [Brucella ovis 63/96]ENS95896.1 hypothetical protein C009_02852 [Brucella ovis 81/8]ENT75678.1 hypothetical protein H712_02981 [Brucella ovis IntaBari-2009-88-4]
METKNHVLTDIDYQVLAEWRYRSRRFMSFSATAAEAEGLPPQQHQALLAIKASGPDKLMTVGTLAERLVVAPHTATELTGRLVAAGLVARVVDLADRRRHTLELTIEAEHILGRVCIQRNQIIAHARWTKPMNAVNVFSHRSAIRR